jgi:hypothetical protein
MLDKLKALLLIPAGFAGAFTQMGFEAGSRVPTDALAFIVIVTPVYIGLILLLRWMWRQPPERRYWGHSRRTWAVLLAVAYLAGGALMLVP